MRHQYWLKVNLIDPMRRLWGWPPCIRAFGCGVSPISRGNPYPSELDPSYGCNERNVVRVVSWEPGLSQFLCDAEASHDFHRPSRNVIAPDERELSQSSTLDDNDVDTSPSEIKSQCQADRTGADDQNLRLE